MDARVGYRRLAGGTLLVTYLVMLLGAYTSAIGAGLACPDWPTCYGTLVPFLHPSVLATAPYSTWQIAAEWLHRTTAALAGVLIVGTAIAAWRTVRDRPLAVWTALLALAFLPLQVLLGGLTVTQALEPVVVTAHLGVAIVILLALQTTVVASGPRVGASGQEERADT